MAETRKDRFSWKAGDVTITMPKKKSNTKKSATKRKK